MKNHFNLKGLSLGVCNLFSKIIGLIFIFTLANDIKDYGLYLYTYAYIPFSIFLDISALGLIPSVSKAVSKHITLNEENKIYYLLKIGTIISIILGIIFFLLLNLFNERILSISLYNGYTNDEYNLILYHLKISSYSLLIFPLLSFLRGYIQGKLKFFISGLSIIIESLTRILLYLYISQNISIDLIYKAFIINFISYLSSLLFLIIIILKDYFKNKTKYNVITSLFKMSIPFGTVTMFYTFYQLIDSITLSKLHTSPHIYSAYMFETNRLIFIPIVFLQSIAAALNPTFNTMLCKNKTKEANRTAKGITKLIITILIPIIILLNIFSKEIYTFFYNNEQLYYILSHTSILIFFIGFYKVLIGISSGIKKFNYIIAATIISLFAKAILNIILIPKLSYVGAIIASITSITICILASYYALNRSKINLFVNNLITILYSLISAFLALLFTYSIKILIIPKINSLRIEIIFISLIFILLYSLGQSIFTFIIVTKNRNYA